MAMKEEVVKTYKMLKDAGFEMVDIIFEGSMAVKKQDVLSQIEELASKNKAMGVVKILYSSGQENFRQIEIPVGEIVPREEEQVI